MSSGRSSRTVYGLFGCQLAERGGLLPTPESSPSTCTASPSTMLPAISFAWTHRQEIQARVLHNGPKPGLLVYGCQNSHAGAGVTAWAQSVLVPSRYLAFSKVFIKIPVPRPALIQSHYLADQPGWKFLWTKVWEPGIQIQTSTRPSPNITTNPGYGATILDTLLPFRTGTSWLISLTGSWTTFKFQDLLVIQFGEPRPWLLKGLSRLGINTRTSCSQGWAYASLTLNSYCCA